jgi:signal transduction histidine kinase
LAHEINNPLTVVMESLRDLQRLLTHDEWNDSRELVERRLSAASECAERIRRVVGEMATFGSAEAPHSLVDVRHVVDAAVSAVKNEHDRPLNISVDAELVPAVLANENHLVQVFVHLLNNAIQAVADPERDCRITVRIRQPVSDQVEVVVADEGRGMDARLMSHIFEPFFTTRQLGSGLGLSFCHAIVTAIGGSIDVKSAPHTGTTVRVLLPAAVFGLNGENEEPTGSSFSLPR